MLFLFQKNKQKTKNPISWMLEKLNFFNINLEVTLLDIFEIYFYFLSLSLWPWSHDQTNHQKHFQGCTVRCTSVLYIFWFRWTFAFCLELQIIKSVLFFFFSFLLFLLYLFSYYTLPCILTILKLMFRVVGCFCLQFFIHIMQQQEDNGIAKFHTLLLVAV